MGRKYAPAGYRELGAAMRKLREAAGLTGRQIGRRIGWDPSRVSRIESGQVQIDVALLCWYLGILRVPHDVAVPLVDLCRKAKMDKGYWLSAHEQRVPDSLSSLIYHEATAAVSTSYEPQLVPGLLQTERYAQAIIGSDSTFTEAQVEASVRIRLERQQVLSQRNRARFVFYLHEQALRLVVGDSDVMHEQMLALALASSAPNLVIRVVPSSAGERSSFGEMFRLFQFEEYQPLIYLGGFATALWLEDSTHVAAYKRLLPQIDRVATSAEESREFIAALADDYDRGSMPHAANLEEE